MCFEVSSNVLLTSIFKNAIKYIYKISHMRTSNHAQSCKVKTGLRTWGKLLLFVIDTRLKTIFISYCLFY